MSDGAGSDRSFENEQDDRAEREDFLNYNYREPMELAKQSIGIFSGILLFSINFSDKMGGIQNSPPSYKYILLSSWALVLVSIALCGLSMVLSWNSARYMLWGQDKIRPPGKSRGLSMLAAKALTAAGIMFVLGLAMMIAGGFISSAVRPA